MMSIDNDNTSEELLSVILLLYEQYNKEISMIECLRIIQDETDLSCTEISKLLDEQTKLILKENALEFNLFRKSFVKKPNYKKLDI